jgi:hypothetical protein
VVSVTLLHNKEFNVHKFNYTYRIHNVNNNKMYIGSRSCNIHPKKDLGLVYFSSSRDKDFIRDQKVNPSNYEYLILDTFETREEADLYESKLHNEYDVDKNTMFYNRAKQTTTKFRYDPTGTKLSEEHKCNIGKALKGRKVSNSTREKLKNANLGKTLTEDCKRKLSEAHIGKKHNKETKDKMAEARKTRVGYLAPNWGKQFKRAVCMYCNKEVSINTINQYHNDNCKEKGKR